jgi:hypothetical protein
MTVEKSSGVTLFACPKIRSSTAVGPIAMARLPRVFSALPGYSNTSTRNTTSPETLIFTLSRKPLDEMTILIWH